MLNDTEDIADKLLISEGTRTFDLKAVEVLILDGEPDMQGEGFAADCEIEFENPVPITRDHSRAFSDVIGTAVLYRQGRSLVADLFVAYDTPERLCLEQGAGLYPSVGGTTFGRDGQTITQAQITTVALTLARNADPRIAPAKA